MTRIIRAEDIPSITERAVFELREGRITLLEVAPSVDLERDILGQMDFMPEELIHPTWGGLRRFLERKLALV